MLTFTHVCPQPAVYLTRYDRIAPDVLGASARSLGKQNSPPLSGSFAQDAADATVRRSVQKFAHLLCHIGGTGSHKISI